MATTQEPTPAQREDAPLSREDIEAQVGHMIEDARLYISEELDALRAKATDYYMGRPFGNEEDGRSQVVSTDVRDTVQAVLPSLMRVFFSPERVVEYKARRPETEEQADQATEYINYIVAEDNQGFTEIHAALKDALVRKTGIIKWWWEYEERVEGTKHTGLSAEQLDSLLTDLDLKVQVTGSTMQGDQAYYDAEVTRTITDGRARLAACPPETVAWNRGARSLDDALIVVHTDDRPLFELLAMGYPREVLEEASATGYRSLEQQVERSRRFDQNNYLTDPVYDQDTRPVRYDEAYVRLDLGEGVALYRLCFVGDAHVMVGEPTKMRYRPFALFVPDPEPHTIVGLDYADYTMDIQRIKSMVWRGTLDSLSLSLIPRTEAVEGMVNMADLLNTEIGAVVRTRQPGMVREIVHRFVGADALPMMAYADEVMAGRTGQSKGSQGLEPEALQSTTKLAVGMTYSAAQQHMELLARIFAETGFRTLFRGLLQLVIENQDRPRTIRLRGQYVEMDPRSWDATMDVQVNVALGAGMIEERLATLQAIAEKQEQVLQTMGPNNPLVSLRQYRNTLARMTELSGHKNSAAFWKEITPEQEQQMDAAAAQAKSEPTDPAAIMAEIEKQKVEIQAMKAAADVEIAQAQNAMRAKEIELLDDRERDKHAADVTLRLQEQEMEHRHAMEKARLDAEIELEKLRIQVELDRQKMLLDAEVKRDIADVTAQAARYKAMVDAKAKETIAEHKPEPKKAE